MAEKNRNRVKLKDGNFMVLPDEDVRWLCDQLIAGTPEAEIEDALGLQSFPGASQVRSLAWDRGYRHGTRDGRDVWVTPTWYFCRQLTEDDKQRLEDLTMKYQNLAAACKEMILDQNAARTIVRARGLTYTGKNQHNGRWVNERMIQRIEAQTKQEQPPMSTTNDDGWDLPLADYEALLTREPNTGSDQGDYEVSEHTRMNGHTDTDEPGRKQINTTGNLAMYDSATDSLVPFEETTIAMPYSEDDDIKQAYELLVKMEQRYQQDQEKIVGLTETMHYQAKKITELGANLRNAEEWAAELDKTLLERSETIDALRAEIETYRHKAEKWDERKAADDARARELSKGRLRTMMARIRRELNEAEV